MHKEEDVLSMRFITSSYTHFHLEPERTTSLTGDGITTLSVLLRDLSVISLLQRAINTLPTLPKLRALRVEVRGDLKDEREVATSVVSHLLWAAASSLISFHLTTDTTILRGRPQNLPKLQRFRLELSNYYRDSIGITSWQLPSLQCLEISLDPLGDDHVHGELATALGAQLRSCYTLHSRYLIGNEFWENFPILASLRVHCLWRNIVLPPIHHPMRELVVDVEQVYSRAMVRMLIRKFIGVAHQHSQASGPTVMPVSRKVVLAGLKWTEDHHVIEAMVFPHADWKELASYVEDELGETLASAGTRFPKKNSDLMK
jgi:hypothetical protein